ncbi:ribosome maturation factor RimP [Collinsella tanakaei]|uniref:Ribosome maturation factor RimP n=1 Tax=Collinsella ihumii TaxID=1720204 RepID=A0ABT7XGC4_9ACTN|nr:MULTISPECIES: ribosome maturation factor RimP [Collinsella]MBM6688304.1 ribosome maturation factor RimP [Collinsella tanakaei]MBM6785779.1 ribosome maturation factor RimP [Collinsella tanakaei]MDN0064461.1 ribosome maturation factor RimP [Collinsella ihumii]OUO58133.1 ribosome maturation factor [Collinsella sp. An271]
MVKSKLEQDIIDALEAVAPEHGIDIVDVEIVGATKAPCVRVRIDRLDGEGISLDEVTAQNAWVSDAVEKLDPISGSYTLEVSSPGMARPLRRPSDFERYIGSAVELVTTATEGRRKFKGTIAATDEQAVTLELEDGEQVSIPHGDVKKCALKPVYDFKGGKGDK